MPDNRENQSREPVLPPLRAEGAFLALRRRRRVGLAPGNAEKTSAATSQTRLRTSSSRSGRGAAADTSSPTKK